MKSSNQGKNRNASYLTPHRSGHSKASNDSSSLSLDTNDGSKKVKKEVSVENVDTNPEEVKRNPSSLA